MNKTGKKILFSIVILGFFSLGLKLDDGVSYRALAGPRNIYLYDTLLMISDSSTGIQIYSVANERSPRFMQRIPLGGNSGIAMRKNVLYANSFGRILAITLTGDETYEISSTIKNDPNWHSMGNDYQGWGCESPAPVQPYVVSEGAGMGGSYAQFAVVDSFLYYIDNSSVVTMDISTPQNPVTLNETFVDWSIETVFPSQQYLFIGSSMGVYIMDRSNPAQPRQLGLATHFHAYDPVVVRDTFAYVTLSAGWNKFSMQNELLVADIANPSAPDSIASTPLSTPYGLAVSDSFLYVALGSNGFCLLNVKNPYAIATVKSWPSIPARDFIWLGKRLYRMGLSDIGIYDVTDPASPALLSTIR